MNAANTPFSYFSSRLGRDARRSDPPVVVWVPAVLVTALLLLPIAYLILRAAGTSAEVLEALLRPRTLQILYRTAALIAAVGGCSVLLAVPIAWLTVRTDLPLRRVITVLAALPLVVPSYVGAHLFLSALGPRGALQQMLELPFGIERLPSIYGFPGAALSLTMMSYPYVYLAVRGTLWRLDPSMEEAAHILGKSAAKTALLVTLPMLRPAIGAGFLLVALYVLSDFGAVAMFRYETFTWAIYLQYQAVFDRTGAAALSLVLVVFALLLLWTEMASRGSVRYARIGPGVSRVSRVVLLGNWRWPALLFCAVVLALALALPFGVLAYWIVLGAPALGGLGGLWKLIANSMYVSLIAAVATVVASLPIGLLAVRFGGRLSRWIEQAAYVSFALPGLVIALALVFFGAQYAPIIYQTLPLLILAYMIHFLPAALGPVRASMLNVSPTVEEAAKSLGRGPFGVLLDVTLPLIRPGLLSGASMVFLLTMKELPVTLLLAPLEFKTLATSVWTFSTSGHFAETAVPALALLTVSSIPMAFLLLSESE